MRRAKQREYQQQYLARPGRREAHRRLIDSRKASIRDWLRDLKGSLRCARCGEDRPQTLDFHHLDPATKDFSLGDAIKRGFSRERILREIDRCEVVCANCHRLEHAGW